MSGAKIVAAHHATFPVEPSLSFVKIEKNEFDYKIIGELII